MSTDIYDFLEHFDISTEARKAAADRDEALPDGSYPIRNKADLQRAIQAFGRASDKEKVKRWIIKRAKELDAVDLLPESWDVAGSSTEHSTYDVDDFLEHFGVKGMKWGVRKDNPEGVSSRTNREARKDAEEFARAKMFYGEGAGNRRKLIKATVEAKSKKDASYKKAFDHHLEKQDMSGHASAARGERKRKDVVKSTAKTARGIKNVILGNPQYASLAALALAGAGSAAYKAGLHKKVMRYGKTAYSQAKTTVRAMQIKQQFKKNGWG